MLPAGAAPPWRLTQASRQAFAILDEIVMGGAVFETSSLEALRSFNEMQRCARVCGGCACVCV